VHSFTPELDPPNRCFDIGLLYDPGHELEKVLAERLFLKLTRAGMRVEHNRPYSGLADGLTTALRNRLAQDRYTSMEIEINQGSMRGDWVNRVAEAIVGGLK
jgi:predicted N-formylglutamate amidohydrolase